MLGTAAGARGIRRSVPGCAASPSTAGKVRLHGQLCTAPTSSAKQCPAPPFPTAEQCCRALLLREPAWPLGYSLHGTGVYRDTGLHIWEREGLPNLHLSASLWLPAGCRQVEGKGLAGPVCFGMRYPPLGGMRLWSSLSKPWKRIPGGGWGAGLESHSPGYALPASTVGLSARGALPWSVCGSWWLLVSSCLTPRDGRCVPDRELGSLGEKSRMGSGALPETSGVPLELGCACTAGVASSLLLQLAGGNNMQGLAEGLYFGVFTGLCHSARHL